MNGTVLFVHGMFQNAQSWDGWIRFFSQCGYECLAESWPLHEGEPAELRLNPPPGLGDLRLQTVIDRYVDVIHRIGIRPLVIGHSLGGFIAQKLVELGLVRAAVAIASGAPNGMIPFNWGFLSYAVKIADPFLGNKPFEMTSELFYRNFANTLSESASNAAFEATAVHESRNVLRDCLLEPGRIDLSRQHAPLLFIGAEQDVIIPAELCEKNARAYDGVGLGASYELFPGRSHFICGEPGWEEVAGHVADWLETCLSAG